MKQLAIITSLFFSVIYTRAQSLDALLKKSTTELSKGIKGVPVSSNEISNGLKEALSIGVTKGANLLSQPDGFFANAALKILLPPEAKYSTEIIVTSMAICDISCNRKRLR